MITEQDWENAKPFDLEKAKDGDMVEIMALSGWVLCKSKSFERRKFPLIQLDHISVSEFNLRMKYPPRKQGEVA